jgi:glycosyltransferase involved in cell wall biosynthesis
LGITNDQILVLYVGRIVQDKGVFELLDAMVLANSINPRITCVLLGSKPAFDQTTVVREKVRKTERLRKCVTVLPSCSPDEVWEYLCAADIFGFPSHREGMPNSLLEAMAMGIPAITFAIPPVLQIRGETECIVVAPQSDSKSFGEAIVRLAGAPHERSTVGERGKVRVMEHFMLRDKAAEVVQRLKGIVSARRSYVAVGS